MLDEKTKELILARDSLILYRFKADQEYDAATTEEDKEKFKKRMAVANQELGYINEKLGL